MLPWAKLIQALRVRGLHWWLRIKNLPEMHENTCNAGDCLQCRRRVQSLGWEDPLEKEMATDSSILAWRIPWAEELCGLQFLRLQEWDTT